jgi:hypothetical protein
LPAAGFSTTPGCNVRTANNNTLVQTLLQDATVRTNQPLGIRLASNVTLGPGIAEAINIRRPVILLGMMSAVTSVDFGMTVNVLNVTTPGAQLYWQGLVLENLAPGELSCLGRGGGGGARVIGGQ